MKANARKALSLMLVLALLVSAMSLNVFAASEKVNGYTDGSNTVRIVSKKSYTLVDGVTETDIIMNDQTGDAQVMGFMTTISSTADVSLKATYNGYYSNYSTATGQSTWEPGNWSLSKTSEQVADYEKATGGNVVFATNGDYFNMQTGQPSGPLFINGMNCNPGKVSAEPYFAVLKDGSYAIRDAGTPTDDVAEAVGSPFYLVRDGQNACSPELGADYPVNSVGVRADGTLVFFMADGRQYPNSVGMSQYEQAEFLIAQGVVTALYLDGGGSATVMSKREGEDKIKIRNSPSDGVERSISSGFVLVANASGNGIFDHATITPDGDSFTPGSTVQLEAAGVDSASGAAELPETGLSWALAAGSEALGSVDAQNGIFTSNGTQGDATVQLLYEGAVVGEALITITEPDELYFNSPSVSLDFGEQSTLGLVVRKDNVEIGYGENDFSWTIAAAEEGTESAQIGTMTGNTFTAGSSDSTLRGTATVSYTKADGTVLSASVAVEIGKMPLIAFDFEEDVDGTRQTAAHFHWGKNTYVDSGVSQGYFGDYETMTVVINGLQYNDPEQYTYDTISWLGDGKGYSLTGNWGTAVPAGQVFKENGYEYYLWPNGTIATYMAGSLNITTEAEGGQVRFGDYSMELNYDYESYDGSKNANFYVRYCGDNYTIEGMPTKAGVWVYADASAQGYMLYCDIEVWNGSNYTTKNLTLCDPVTESNVITWTGWKYLEADLKDLAAYYSEEHPYTILNGYGLFWVSYQPGKNNAGRKAGTLYFDNYRFVYGTDLDDLDNPEISEIAVNGVTLDAAGNDVIQSSDVEITAAFKDVDGNNASGIDATATSIRIDGNSIICDGDETQATTRLALGNGRHSVTVTVYDQFGNYATETRYFTIQNEETVATATLSGEDTVTMGSGYELRLTTAGTVSELEASVIQVNSDFGEPVATFAEGWTGEVVYTNTGFKKAKMTITAKWTGEGDAPADTTVAKLTFEVPTDMDPDFDYFTYQVSNMTCTQPDGTVTTAAQPAVKLALSAYYTLEAEIAVAGFATGMTVRDKDGAVAPSVEVFVNGESIGTTDENGYISAVVSETMTGAQSFTAYVQKGTLVSFTKTVTVMSAAGYEDGKPVGVALSASKDGSTMQTISWMASSAAAEAAAVVRYAATEDMAEAVTVTGTSTLHAFATTKDAARINVAAISGLTPETTYYYQVGDGQEEHWSEVASFHTVKEEAVGTTFFVVGDTQMSGNPESDADAITLLDQIAEGVKGCDFGIQTGDYVDNGGNYSMWQEIQEEFGTNFTGIDMVHTMGNHEYYGDAAGSAAEALFNMSSKEELYYSVEYGNVYVAVINYAANLSEAAEWLVQDAQASDATWKVLSIHQPPYYTNVNGGSAAFNEIIPAAAEKAGIHAVFSGHDHAYARTKPMTAGAVDEDQGVTYFVCGDLGEKSRNVNYAATDTPEFNFDIVRQDYDAVYIKITAGETEMQVTTYNADGTILDSCTIELYIPCADGHTWETYNRATGEITCSVCGLVSSAADELYSGWIADSETGRQLYLIAGKPETGHVYISSEHYYFDDDGLAYDGEYEMCGETVSFKDGQYVEGSNPNVISAGKAGPEADFIVTTDGLLNVDGTGSLYAHSTYGTVQWYPVKNEITALRVGKDITALGSFCFSDLFKLEEVYFEEGSQLGNCPNYCFANDASLKALIFPETVKTVGFRAFAFCKSLEFLYLPDVIQYFGDYAFDGCSALTLSVLRNTKASSYAERNSINALYRNNNEEHSWTEWTNYTCADNDYTGYRYCTTCGVVEQRYGLTNGFEDVAESDYYYNAVLWASANKVVYGTSETTFAPGKGCTRAEIVAFLWRNAGCPAPESTETTFTDIDPEAYYYDAVLWANENGIVYGTSETTFAPNKTCTRAETVAFLYRAAGCPTPESTETAFTDIDPEAYYYVAVLWATENGIVYGTSDTTFAPAKTCTRAQVVAFLYRAEGAPEV